MDIFTLTYCKIGLFGWKAKKRPVLVRNELKWYRVNLNCCKWSNVGKISDCCLVKLHLTYPSNVDRADRRQTGSPVTRLEIRRSNPIIDSFYWSISLLLIGPDERLASVTRLGHFFTDLATYLHTKVGQIFDNFWPVLISVTFIVTTTVATFGQFWKNIGLLLLQHLFPQL